MHNFLALLTAFSGLAISTVVTAEVADVKNLAYWLCKNKAEVRTIRVHQDGALCSTLYTKLGSEKSVGSGKSPESCLNFLNNIKTNLEKSNWDCRDISSARMTASE